VAFDRGDGHSGQALDAVLGGFTGKISRHGQQRARRESDEGKPLEIFARLPQAHGESRQAKHGAEYGKVIQNEM
jgi:hypothetical protein